MVGGCGNAERGEGGPARPGRGAVAPAPAGGSASLGHTTVISSDYPLRVQVRPDADGRWFRLLNWLVDGGGVARLSGAALRTMLVLARHADEGGLSHPSILVLLRQTGLPRSTLYAALRELRSDECPMIAADAASRAWRLFPGRSFAGGRRRAVQPIGRSSSGLDSAVQPTGQKSSPLDRAGGPPPRPPRAGIQDGGGCAAAGRRDISGDAAAAAAGELDGVGQGGGADAIDPAELETSVAVLASRRGGCFLEAEARHLLRETGATLRQVMDAVDSAEAMRARGRLRTSVRRCVRWILRSGRGLFDEAAEDRARAAEGRAAAPMSAGPGDGPGAGGEETDVERAWRGRPDGTAAPREALPVPPWRRRRAGAAPEDRSCAGPPAGPDR